MNSNKRTCWIAEIIGGLVATFIIDVIIGRGWVLVAGMYLPPISYNIYRSDSVTRFKPSVFFLHVKESLLVP